MKLLLVCCISLPFLIGSIVCREGNRGLKGCQYDDMVFIYGSHHKNCTCKESTGDYGRWKCSSLPPNTCYSSRGLFTKGWVWSEYNAVKKFTYVCRCSSNLNFLQRHRVYKDCQPKGCYRKHLGLVPPGTVDPQDGCQCKSGSQPNLIDTSTFYHWHCSPVTKTCQNGKVLNSNWTENDKDCTCMKAFNMTSQLMTLMAVCIDKPTKTVQKRCENGRYPNETWYQDEKMCSCSAYKGVQLQTRCQTIKGCILDNKVVSPGTTYENCTCLVLKKPNSPKFAWSCKDTPSNMCVRKNGLYARGMEWDERDPKTKFSNKCRCSRNLGFPNRVIRICLPKGCSRSHLGLVKPGTIDPKDGCKCITGSEHRLIDTFTYYHWHCPADKKHEKCENGRHVFERWMENNKSCICTKDFTNKKNPARKLIICKETYQQGIGTSSFAYVG